MKLPLVTLNPETFGDLNFSEGHSGSQRALATFPNGYALSIVLGPSSGLGYRLWMSNGVDTFEMAIMKVEGDNLKHVNPFENWDNGVYGHLTTEALDTWIDKVRTLPPLSTSTLAETVS